MIEIVVLNRVLTLAMQALPLETLGGGNPEAAGHAHRDDMLRLLAEYYVGPVFAAGASLIFAFLLLSAVNTAVTDLVSIQFMMARDRELPRLFGGLNRWGMPAVPLLVAAVIPALVVFVVPDVADLADLYAVGVIGAITVNLATTSTNFALSMKRWERGGMLALALALTAMWLTIVYQKPWAFLFTMSIVGVGLTCRWLVQHRDDIRDYLLTPVPTFLAPTPPDLRQPMMAAPEAIEEPPAESAAAAPAPGLRIMVAARGDPALLRFATEEARSRRAALLVLFVRHLPITTMGSTNNPDARDDLEAQFVFQAVEPMARRAQVPVTYLYAVAEDVADAILDLAATHGANFLILGASRRSTLWRTMKGDILQRVALHLPERTTLLIHA
ncbi:MAG: universal stress protein, partial [Gemmataceae bacterium]